VTGIDTAEEIALVNGYGCSRSAAGRMECWALDAEASPPPALDGVRRLHAGAHVLCAELASDEVQCWGPVRSGSGFSPASAWSRVSTGEPIIDVAVSRGPCVLDAAGEVTCWRRAWRDGPEAPPVDIDGPIAVTAFAGVEAIAPFNHGLCGLRSGDVECFGDYDWAEAWAEPTGAEAPAALFQGRTRPILRLAGVTDAVAVHGHDLAEYACFEREGGGLDCFGQDAFGELTGQSFPLHNAPNVERFGPTPRAEGALGSVAVGPHGACRTDAQGALTCWGAFDLAWSFPNGGCVLPDGREIDEFTDALPLAVSIQGATAARAALDPSLRRP
jgi:hypothetical protein